MQDCGKCSYQNRELIFAHLIFCVSISPFPHSHYSYSFQFLSPSLASFSPFFQLSPSSPLSLSPSPPPSISLFFSLSNSVSAPLLPSCGLPCPVIVLGVAFVFPVLARSQPDCVVCKPFLKTFVRFIRQTIFNCQHLDAVNQAPPWSVCHRKEEAHAK